MNEFAIIKTVNDVFNLLWPGKKDCINMNENIHSTVNSLGHAMNEENILISRNNEKWIFWSTVLNWTGYSIIF